MRLTVTPMDIPEAEPFRNDLLGRKKAADALTDLVRSSTDPLVLCIDAPWGQGKTTFLRMWQADMRHAGIPTVAFSAWEHDFAEDPLIAMIGEIETQFATLKDGAGENEGSAHRNLEVAKKWGLKFAKAALPTAVKIATAGALDLNNFTEEALANLGERVVANKLADYEEGRQSIEKFRAALAQFAGELGSRDGETSVPLVVLIDELDRCRPTYAIQLLERLKHLFAVPNTVYILALDREQLGHAVRSQYGERIDADGYLRRFFDLEFRLPEPPAGAFGKAQFARFGLEPLLAERRGGETRYDREQLEGTLAALFEAFDCSLRDQERAFSMLSLAFRTTPKNYFLYPILLSTLVVLKLKDGRLYKDFADGKQGPDAVLRAIASSEKGKEFLASNYGVALEAHVMACQLERHRRNDVTVRYVDQANDASLPVEAQQRAQRMIEILNSHQFSSNAFGILPYLIEKVDLASSFRT